MGNRPISLCVRAGEGYSVQVEIPQVFRGRFHLLRPHPLIDLSPGICDRLVANAENDLDPERYTELFISSGVGDIDGTFVDRIQSCAINSKKRVSRQTATLQQ